MTAAEWLRDRARSYGRDATALRQQGDTDSAAVMETIRDELKRVADGLDTDTRRGQ